MKRLGSVTLPDSIRWTNQYAWSPVTHTTMRTLAGYHHTWVSVLRGGQPIDLEAEPSKTWLSKAHVDAIMDMASQPGAVFDLEIEGKTFQVMFRHDGSYATAFSKIHHHKTCELYTGSIKLVTV
ncbi:MAG: hypothetical protein H7829_03370 [Magnetococcus sp. THC-1_WYH]